MTAFKTVFDATEAGWQTWPAPAFGLVFIATGFFLWQQKKARRGFAIFVICFALLWTGSTCWFTYGEYAAVHSAIKEKRVKYVEGVVSNFVPMPYNGHAMESFCIGDGCFTYSDYVVTTGFNNTAAHGGPITGNDMIARITYVGIDHGTKLRNIIIKVEVEDKGGKK